MRILVVCQYYYPENVVITPICEDLVKRGHEVHVVTGKPNYDFGEILPGYERINDEIVNGVFIHRLDLSPRKDSRLSLIKNYLSFWRHSKHYLAHLKDNYDIVYGMSMSPLLSLDGAGVYAKKHQVPELIHCLDLWPESAVIAGNVRKGSLFYKILYRSSRRIYSSADEILISSPSFEEYFRNVLKLPEMKIVPIPQPPLVSPLPSTGIPYTKKLNIVYAGNLGNLQLIENYVNACALVNPNYDFTFHILGAGSRLNDVLKIVEAKHLEDRVTYHSIIPASDVPAYFVNATALVVSLADTPSPVSKTIPNKLISSLYYGRVILASIGGDGHKVLEEAGGSFFATEDPADIARNIEKIFSSSPESLQKMGENNKKYFTEHYDFTKVMDHLESELKLAKKS
jgi:glycosyltransferase involved in cell wall biosynthesis